MNRAERRRQEREARKGRASVRPACDPPADAVPDEILDDPTALRPTVAWGGFEPLRSALLVESGVLVPWGDPLGQATFPSNSQLAGKPGRLAGRLADDPAFAHYAAALGATIEGAVTYLLKLWNGGGRIERFLVGYDVERSALGVAVAEAFGLPPGELVRPAVAAFGARHGAALRAFMRAQYVETQAWLRGLGVARAQLWRGAAGAGPDGFRPMGLVLQPISAWTPSFEVAVGFARRRARQQRRSARLLLAEIPRERILSTALTGAGCPGLVEVLVVGGPAAAWALTWREPAARDGGAPLYLERTFLLAAEHAAADGDHPLLTDPVWRSDWLERVRAGQRPGGGARRAG